MGRGTGGIDGHVRADRTLLPLEVGNRLLMMEMVVMSQCGLERLER